MASVEAWTEYLASQDSTQLVSESLLEELLSLESTVFVEDSPIFDIIDVTTDGIRARGIEEEGQFSAFLSEDSFPRLRIISICQDASIEPLNITSDWAARLLQKYHVRTDFLRILLAFGDTPHIPEASSGSSARYDEGDGNYTVLYRLPFVEKSKQERLNLWSRRQLGVYHQHRQGTDLFIIVHGSSSSVLCRKLSEFTIEIDDKTPLEIPGHNYFSGFQDMHNLVFSSYMDNWRPYIRDLAVSYSKINDQAMVANIAETGEESFQHVKELRNTKDKVSYAIACCMSNLAALSSTQPSIGHMLAAESSQVWHTLLSGYIESAKLLQDSISNSIELVGYTLTAHNQLETARLDREIRDATNEMRNLAKETSQVTKRLKELTENTVDDSAIVRIITIVSAVYLPGSFVASIFGTNFFVFEDKSMKINISNDFWKFIVTWIALTIVTCAIYGSVYVQKRHKRTERRRAILEKRESV